MEAIWNTEIMWITALQTAVSGLTSMMRAITFLGSVDFFILVMPILYWCVDTGLGLRVGLILLLSGHLNGIFKVLFHSPRPFWVSPEVKALSVETSFGMPSGHSMNTLSIWGLAAYLFNKRWFTLLSILVIILVGLSRLALGMHFLSDVLASWMLGLILLLCFVLLEKKVAAWLSHQKLSRLLWIVATSTVILILLGYFPNLFMGEFPLPAEWIQNARLAGEDLLPVPYDTQGIFTTAGIWLGMGIGVSIIHRRGGLPRAGSLKNQLLRYVIGLAGLMILWYGLGAVFPRGEELLPLLLRMLRYSLVGFWIGAGAPCIYLKLNLFIRCL